MTPENKPLHRLKAAREMAGISLRTMARKTGIPVRRLRVQEVSNDVPLEDLLRWRKALGVPFSELVNESSEQLDEVVRMRAGLIQIMRGVNSLLHGQLTERQDAVVQNMATELKAIMPELDEIKSWPSCGSTRRRDEPSHIESQIVATSQWFPEFSSEA